MANADRDDRTAPERAPSPFSVLGLGLGLQPYALFAGWIVTRVAGAMIGSPLAATGDRYLPLALISLVVGLVCARLLLERGFAGTHDVWNGVIAMYLVVVAEGAVGTVLGIHAGPLLFALGMSAALGCGVVVGFGSPIRRRAVSGTWSPS